MSLAEGSSTDTEASGAHAYEAWARSIEDPTTASLTDEALRGRMGYHAHWIGHLVAQKWNTSVGLRSLEATPFCVGEVLHAWTVVFRRTATREPDHTNDNGSRTGMLVALPRIHRPGIGTGWP